MSTARITSVVGAAAALTLAGALAAPQGMAGEGDTDLISVRLDATRYNAGRVGNAVLYPVDGKTGITLLVSGVPDYTTRPIHLYTYVFEGSCTSREAGTTYPLTDRTLAESVTHPMAVGALRGPVRISRTLALPFESLRTMPHAISVRLAPTDGNFEILCGDISS